MAAYLRATSALKADARRYYAEEFDNANDLAAMLELEGWIRWFFTVQLLFFLASKYPTSHSYCVIYTLNKSEESMKQIFFNGL